MINATTWLGFAGRVTLRVMATENAGKLVAFTGSK